jgi:hypothetical protein
MAVLDQKNPSQPLNLPGALADSNSGMGDLGPKDTVEEASWESYPASDPPSWTPITAIGPPPCAAATEEPPTAAGERRQRLARQTRSEYDAVLDAVHRLEAALVSAAPGRECDWTARVVQELAGVQQALRRHADSARCPRGLWAALECDLPRLAGRVERLRRENADLLQQAQALTRLLAHHDRDERPNCADVRLRAAWLLGALRHHQALEADLIYETFCLDV